MRCSFIRFRLCTSNKLFDTRSLQESFIANVWNASREANLGDVDILKSLQKLTGLTTNTLRAKVIRRDKSEVETVKHLYENL
jgi:hypothetical protein